MLNSTTFLSLKASLILYYFHSKDRCNINFTAMLKCNLQRLAYPRDLANLSAQKALNLTSAFSPANSENTSAKRLLKLYSLQRGGCSSRRST